MTDVQSRQVLIISQEPVGPHMAGPGIRYWELARVLAREFHVTLAAPPPLPEGANGLQLMALDDQALPLQHAAERADVTLVGGFMLSALPFLTTLDRPLVVDAYIPYPLETLELNSQFPITDQVAAHAHALLTLNTQFMAADLVICASERQRDLWLGTMLAQGRINPLTYQHDVTLRRLIDVVPFGLPEDPPVRSGPVLRGAPGSPAIAESDRIIVWGGGIWQWLDPLTLIRAVARIVEQHPEVRLFFPGTRHPYVAGVPEMQMRQAAIALSDELGLTGRHVILGDWVPYEERQNYLLEADIGASLHLNTLEARFAFRTRLLDYIWAGLPILASRGDSLADLVKEENLGYVVEPEDVDGVTEALLQMLATPNLRQVYRPRFERVAARLTWPQAAEPLLRFCREPRRTADRQPVERNLALAWIGALQHELRSSDRASLEQMGAHVHSLVQHGDNLAERIRQLEELLAGMTQHAQNLEGQLAGVTQHARNLEMLLDECRRGVAQQMLTAVRRRMGKES